MANSARKLPQGHPRTDTWLQVGWKLFQERPKMVPRGAEEGHKSDVKPQDKQEPPQDDDMTDMDPQPPAHAHFSPPPRGAIGTPKAIPKRTRTQEKIGPKTKKRKQAIQDDQRSVLGRSWSLSGCHVEAKHIKNWKTYYFVNCNFLDDAMVRRRF